MSEDERRRFPSRGEWSPYMCPSCRGLFRAPTDREGKVECPLCDSAILLPHREVKEQQKAIEPLARKRKVQEETAEWDKKTTTPLEPGPGSGGVVLIAFFIFSLLIAVGVYFLLQDRKARLAANDQPNVKFRTEQFQAQNTKSDDGKKAAPNKKEGLLQLNADDLEVARAAAEDFLACETIEDYAPLIRDSERVMPLIRNYYAKEPFQPVGVLKINEQGRAQVAKRFASFEIVLKDYTSQPIAVEITEDGPLVDWESWVGYCEVPWETFIDEKVKKPTLMRLNVTRSYYFNFDFWDDTKWICYELERSSDESVLFGYVPFDSPLKNELPGIGTGRQTFILKIRYPENFSAKNQVLITDLIQSGWVLGL